MTEAPNHKAEIYYYDIGDYLSREQKLDIITNFKSMENLPFTRLTPNEHGDWISQRNEKFSTWISIGDKDSKDNKSTFFVPVYSRGLATARDSWCYCFSKKQLERQMHLSIDFYNEQRKLFAKEKAKNPTANTRAFVNYDDSKLSWNRGILNYCEKNKTIDFEDDSVRISLYRPFCKQNSYFNVAMNDMTYQLDKHFPTPNAKNLVICTKGVGDKDFSCLISDYLPDLQVNFNGQCFPLYWYETIEPEQSTLFGDDGAQTVRHEAVSDFILERAQSKYGNKVQREDIFYYVYGILHSKSYRETFSADLKKMLPRIPLISGYEKFWAFSKAGRKLAKLHLNYEQIAAYPELTIESLENKGYASLNSKNTPGGELLVAEKPKASTSNKEYEYYAVQQMKFPKKGQKDTIIYNHYHTVKNIPEKAYEYVVNGKSAIEWIMERYAVTTDKKSGITNNPNDWSKEHEKPRYILDLLLSIINVSVQTVDIVNALPDVDWEKE
ncbi:MAG: hypothetical protein Q4P16_09530 [Spirochaetales bacterium]|nr:hypothetical protein [Spirochaetales bacterium]